MTDSPLTKRQRELLQLAANGYSTADICRQLVLAQGTVKTHFRELFFRLQANDRDHAVAIALRQKLID